ncbi:MAG TPA: SdpI family protein [Gemmatimonadales bacterium]
MNPDLLFPAAGLLLVLVGWPLARRRVKPNSLYGLRVRATMTDERVWYDANAVAGKDSMVFGAVFAIMALVLPAVGVRGSDYQATCVAVLGAGVLVLMVRGWRTANRMQRQRQGVE